MTNTLTSSEDQEPYSHHTYLQRQEAALLVTVDVPDVKLDGAVVELSVRGGQVAAEVRIPAKD